MTTKKPYLITLPPPTPNGGLHMGHLGGPFLAGDVFSKALRLRGDMTHVICYSDVNQSYVETTAKKMGEDPLDLAYKWTEDIKDTLKRFDIEVDDFFLPGDENNNKVINVFKQLERSGCLVKRSYPFFKDKNEDVYLGEAGVSGYCPNCLAGCKCGICESCGLPTNAENIISPYNTVSGSLDLYITYADVLTIDLNSYREEIAAFYKMNHRFRPRYLQLIDKVLKQGLPVYPITVPGDWGIPYSQSSYPGQVLNAWPEIMAQHISAYIDAEVDRFANLAPPRVVNFFGFDNSFFYAILHLAMLMVINKGKWLPYSCIINEFYNLDGKKFSTSNNHVLWASDMVKDENSDLVRLYCCLNSPGFEKSNFNYKEMREVCGEIGFNYIMPIVDCFNIKLEKVQDGKEIDLHQSELVAMCEVASDNVLRSFSESSFHLRQAAEDLIQLFKFVREKVIFRKDIPLEESLHILVLLCNCAYPIMPSISEDIYVQLAPDNKVGEMPRSVKAGKLLLNL